MKAAWLFSCLVAAEIIARLGRDVKKESGRSGVGRPKGSPRREPGGRSGAKPDDGRRAPFYPPPATKGGPGRGVVGGDLLGGVHDPLRSAVASVVAAGSDWRSSLASDPRLAGLGLFGRRQAMEEREAERRGRE